MSKAPRRRPTWAAACRWGCCSWRVAVLVVDRALDARRGHPRPGAADLRARGRPLSGRQGLPHARRALLHRVSAGGRQTHLGRDRVRRGGDPAGRLLQDHRHDARRGAARRRRAASLLEQAGVAAQRDDLRRPVHELRRRARDHVRLLPGGRHPDGEPHGRPGPQGHAGRDRRSAGGRPPDRRERHAAEELGRGYELPADAAPPEGDADLSARRRARSARWP